MKNLKSALVLVMAVSVFSVSAQNSGIKLSGVQLHAYVGMQQEGHYSLSDYQSMAGNSDLLLNNFYGYTRSNAGVAADLGFGVQGSFRLMKEGEVRANRRLRLGLAGGMSEVADGSYFKNWHTTGDSIYNSSGVVIGYVDSLHNSSYNAHYTGNFLRFDGSMIWSTDELRRVSAYMGAGISAGVVFNAQTTVNHWEDISVRYKYDNASTSMGSVNKAREMELFKSAGGFYSSIYIPIGLNLRLGKVNPFWSHAHFCSEWRPSIVFQNYASTGMKTVFGISHTWGIRWEF